MPFNCKLIFWIIRKVNFIKLGIGISEIKIPFFFKNKNVNSPFYYIFTFFLFITYIIIFIYLIMTHIFHLSFWKPCPYRYRIHTQENNATFLYKKLKIAGKLRF